MSLIALMLIGLKKENRTQGIRIPLTIGIRTIQFLWKKIWNPRRVEFTIQDYLGFNFLTPGESSIALLYCMYVAALKYIL